MQLDVQVKLLRVLESGALTRVGGEREIPVDVRILAATNQLPEIAVANKALREDLYYRLKVFQVTMPPLCERAEDIPLLAQHFLQILNHNAGTKKQLTVDALAGLCSHTWPGNVRELKNVMDAGFILADVNIGPFALGLSASPNVELAQGDNGKRTAPDDSGPAAVTERGLYVPIGTTAAEAERRLILATLQQCRGHKDKTAAMLDLSLKTVYNRLKHYHEQSIGSEDSELNRTTSVR
jgi:DNA-binding NtrC family response regulator